MNEGERIIKLETQMNNIERKVDEGFAAINDKLDKMDSKYANKWVESVLKSIIYTIGVILVGALMILLLKKGLVVTQP